MFYTWGYTFGEPMIEITHQLFNLSKQYIESDEASYIPELLALKTGEGDFSMPIHPLVAQWHKLEFINPETRYNIYGNHWTFKEFIIKYIEYDTSW